jgi:hypothetical protein
MRGFPKYFNSKQDVMNALELFPQQTKAYISNLLATRKLWVQVEYTAPGVEDESHYIRTDEAGNVYQMEYQDDPNGAIPRLGFTVEELEAMI